MAEMRFDHCVMCASYGTARAVARSGTCGPVGVEIEVGPVTRSGARGDGQSVYFRDPDGTLLELISYR